MRSILILKNYILNLVIKNTVINRTCYDLIRLLFNLKTAKPATYFKRGNGNSHPSLRSMNIEKKNIHSNTSKHTILVPPNWA